MERVDAPKTLDTRLMAGSVTVVLLGVASSNIDGGAWERMERKAAAALLLAATGLGHSRERVSRMLWPDSNATAARTNVRVMLHRLRRTFAHEMFDDEHGWDLAAGVHVDLKDLLSGAMTPPDAEIVLDLPLLAGLDYTDLPEFDELRIQLQERLVERAIKTLLDEAEECLRDGRGAAPALHMAALVLGRYPMNEVACRLKMRAHVALGDRSGALSAYESCRCAIARELGAVPDRLTRSLHLEVLRTESTRRDAANAMIDAQTFHPTRLVGRDVEIACLQRAVEEGRHVWLLGDAGMGKSRILDELVLRVEAVRIWCKPSDDAAPYAVLKRLLGRLSIEDSDEPTDGLSTLVPGAAPVLPVDLQLVFDGTLNALRRLRRDGIRALIIDDVHYVDSASARLLCELCEFTACPLTRNELPVLLFAARPHTFTPAYSQLLRAGEVGTRFAQVVLPPLDLHQVQEFLIQLEVPWLSPMVCAERLLGMSGGNPFFMLEIIRAARDTEDPNALMVQVDGIVEMLSRRISGVSDDAKGLVSLLAVAGADFQPGMPHECLMLGAASLDAAWRELMLISIFDAQGFSHDLAMSAALGRLVGPQAQLLHDAVAGFMARHGGAPIRIAHHLLLGTEPGQACPYALEGAKQLWQEGLVEEAIALLDRVPPPTRALPHGFELLWYRHYLLISARKRERWLDSLEQLQRSAATDEQRLMADSARMRWLADAEDGAPAMLATGARHAAPKRLDSCYWCELQAFHALALARSGRKSEACALYDLIRLSEGGRGRCGEVDSTAEGALDHAMSMLAFELEQTGDAEARMQLAVASAESQPWPWLRFRARFNLATIQWYQGKLSSAFANLSEADSLAARRGMSEAMRCRAKLSLARMAIAWGRLDAADAAMASLPPAPQENAERAVVDMLWLHASGDIESAWQRHRALLGADIPGWIDFRSYLQIADVAMQLAEWRDPSATIDRYVAEANSPDFAQVRVTLKLLRSRWRPPEPACEEVLKLLKVSQASGMAGHELLAHTELADIYARMGRLNRAAAHADAAIELAGHSVPHGVTRADHAGRLYSVMRRCDHHGAADWRLHWRAWRAEMSRLFEGEAERDAFLRRHGWMDPD